MWKEETFHKREIVRQHLEAAVLLYLNQLDYSSVITLANAAGTILNQLLWNAGKKPFVDFGRDVFNHLHGVTPKRQSYKHQIDTLWGAIAHKHMSTKCPDEVEIDLVESAKNALAVAVIDYSKLYGDKTPFVVAFLNQLWVSENGPEMMKYYELIPERLRHDPSTA